MPAPTNILWSKRAHKEELELARKLGPELKGALDGIRDLYCHRSGNLPNDDTLLAGSLGATPQKMRALKQKLVEKGCIELVGGSIQCPIAHEDYIQAATLIEQKRQAGEASARKRTTRLAPLAQQRGNLEPAAKQDLIEYNKFNELDRTSAATSLQPERQTKRKGVSSGAIEFDSPRNGEARPIGEIMIEMKPGGLAGTLARNAYRRKILDDE